MLEIFAESRLRREIKAVGDFLNRHHRISEHHFRLQNHIVVYPVQGTLSAVPLYHSRNIFGRQTHLVGIELDAPLPVMVHLEQSHEPVEYLLGARGILD